MSQPLSISDRDDRFKELDFLIASGRGDIPQVYKFEKHIHRMRKFGFDRHGRQRLRCKECGETQVIGDAPPGPREVKKNRILDALLKPGATIRSVTRDLGVAPRTVALYAQSLVSVRPKCPCGQAAGHRGWCGYRYKNSPARQVVVKSFRAPTIMGIDRIPDHC